MADSLLTWLGLAGSLIAAAILIYGGYWAFTIRQALFVRSYRNQALWLGFFSLYVILHGFPVDSVIASINNPVAYFANELYYFFLAVLLFRLIDVDVGLARKSDPLLRDTLHWKRLRLVVWGIMTFSISSLVLLAIASIMGHPSPMSELVPFQASVYVSFLTSGSSALFLGAKRSGDEVFRRSLKWFGLFFLGLLATALVYFVTASGLVNISQDALNASVGYTFIPATYCLYRSARSLAPLGRLPPSE